MKEFDHVVWPTKKETKKFITIVLSFLVIFTLFIYIIGTFFSFALFTSKNAINPAKLPQSPSNSASDLIKNINASGASNLKLDNIKTTTPSAPNTTAPTIELEKPIVNPVKK